MPPKKRSGAGKAGDSKKQKTTTGGAKSSDPKIDIDEGFKDSGK